MQSRVRRSLHRLQATRRVSLAGILLLTAFATMLGPLPAMSAPPFGLPFTAEPGPSTWYVAQWYGNTVWSYRNWPDLYSAGQGLHFGIDFTAPCGTSVVAIGDGVVFAVDGPYGAQPHNVVIDHGDGYLSLYGHLLQRANLRVGQAVRRGQVIALSGDPTGTCTEAPHLHLEIRRPGMSVAVNPVPLIDADWRRATIGADTDGSRFAVDYAMPDRWQTIDDQPDVHFGGPIVNPYSAAWPPR